jgi:uncharacterized protein DUF6968
MDFDALGEIIATRSLYFVDEADTRRTVRVLVGKPQPLPDSTSYFCPFQIIGIGSQRTHLADGSDSIHALQSAMISIAANLSRFNEELGGTLEWNGGDKGLGFP